MGTTVSHHNAKGRNHITKYIRIRRPLWLHERPLCVGSCFYWIDRMFRTRFASDVFFSVASVRIDAHTARSPAIYSRIQYHYHSRRRYPFFPPPNGTELLLQVCACVYVKTPTADSEESVMGNNTTIASISSDSPQWLHWNDSSISNTQSPKPYVQQRRPADTTNFAHLYRCSCSCLRSLDQSVGKTRRRTRHKITSTKDNNKNPFRMVVTGKSRCKNNKTAKIKVIKCEA